MQSYRDLEIYQLAHKLAIKIHRFETYEEGSQIRRSAKGVSSNIVEGFGRKQYRQEYIRFLIFAHSSCNETIEHLEILFETKSISDKTRFDYFMEEYDKLGRKLNKFIQAVRGGNHD